MNKEIFQRVSQEPTIIEFDGKGNDVKTIELDNLAKSIRRETGLAGIRSIPKQYWALYAIITGMLENHGMNYNEEDIMIQNNSSKAYLTDEDKSAGYNSKRAPIEKWRFDKVISLVQIPNLSIDANGGPGANIDARNAAIGLTLNKEGISVSFGMNLHACSNFNVLGGTILRSYGQSGRDGLPWDVMSIRLEDWIKKSEQIWSVQNDIMRQMKAATFPSNSDTVEKVIGDLYIGALKQSYFKGPDVPFNTYELSEFVQETIRQKKEEDSLGNVWDLYNWGTSIMKPGKMDIGQIASNSNMWADYLGKEFALDIPENIVDAEIIGTDEQFD
jgi:hypothetical protein